MKRIICRSIAIVLIACAVFSCMCACAKKEKSIDIDMAQVVEANNTENLLLQYGSVTCAYSQDGQEINLMYVDNELYYYQDNLGNKSIYGDDFEFTYENGKYYGTLICDGSYNTQLKNILMSEDTTKEKVESAKDNGNEITVITTLNEEQTAALAEDTETEYQEGDTLKLTYRLDSNTRALLALSKELVHTDGSATDNGTLKVTYGEERIEDAGEMLERSKPENDLRTLTVVLDPNTENEQAYFRTVRKGDMFELVVPDGYQVYEDEECTVPYEFSEESDTNAHVLLYAKRQ